MSFSISFDKTIYSKSSLIQAAYHFTNRCYIHLDIDHTCFIVRITEKEGMEPPTVGEFENEMLCQEARHTIYQQTKDLRQLLAARALSTSMLISKDDTKAQDSEKSDMREKEEEYNRNDCNNSEKYDINPRFSPNSNCLQTPDYAKQPIPSYESVSSQLSDGVVFSEEVIRKDWFDESK